MNWVKRRDAIVSLMNDILYSLQSHAVDIVMTTGENMPFTIVVTQVTIFALVLAQCAWCDYDNVA